MLRSSLRLGVKRFWDCIQVHRTAAEGFRSASSCREPDVFDPNENCHWVNPLIDVRQLAGKGRGLIAKKAIKTGDLVLAVQPLALLHGPHEDMPDPLALSPILHMLFSIHKSHHEGRQGLPPRAAQAAGWGSQNPLLAARWLPLLHRGKLQVQDAGHPQQQEHSLPYIQALLHQKIISSQSRQSRILEDGSLPASTEVEDAAAEAAGGRHVPHLTEADMMAIVSQNAFGDEYEDLVAADIRHSAHTHTALANSAHSQAQAHTFLESCRSPSSETQAANPTPSGSQAGPSPQGLQGENTQLQACQGLIQAGLQHAGGEQEGSDAQVLHAQPDGDSEDVAQSHVGLWPHFSLLNHSCLPTCVHYVVGSTMVVRAVRDVPAGEELTVSYLGREDFSPASARSRLLEERFGFTCRCPRCQLESCLSSETAQLLQKVSRDCKINLGPTFLSTIEEQDRKGLAQVGSALTAWSRQLQPALAQFLEQTQRAFREVGGGPVPNSSNYSSSSSTTNTSNNESGNSNSSSSSSSSSSGLGDLVVAVGGPEAAVLLIEATAYDYLELLQQHTQLCASMYGGGSDGDEDDRAYVSAAAALHLCGQVLHATSKGSELHVFVAMRLLEVAQQQQAAGGLCTLDPFEAAHACQEALLARYGNMSVQLMERIMRACVKRSRQFIM
ncbi:hypothetical protein DUNSADRAFT_16639 [Dunaliella salina]|uniref:SET domain-containing protein n=1 Tax=Dunaliella salina TaxID=3046 RepID=A0ABQ7G376_DUNSA|nr:hypothetical protein DUNSADRAFT_16639 [Dunaliella salina]|eukprot:KAF5829055.1 hypothetical protein DUNSADRAFT_16639 [Dunaliella salina]